MTLMKTVTPEKKDPSQQRALALISCCANFQEFFLCVVHYVFSGSRLEACLHLPFDKFQPSITEVTFDLRVRYFCPCCSFSTTVFLDVFLCLLYCLVDLLQVNTVVEGSILS